MTNTVTVTEQNNTVQILEDAPVVAVDPWYKDFSSVPTSSGSATVTAGGTSHTKGAWTEIIASNAAETSALLFTVTGIYQNNVNTATLIDVAIGASGAETAIIENIAVGGSASNVFALPYQVAAGARVSVRSQAIIASDTAGVKIETFVLGNPAGVGSPTFDVLGVSTGTSAGTRVTAAYTELVASTTQLYEGFILVGSQTYILGGASFDMTLATGAIGAETPIAVMPGRNSAVDSYSSDIYICFVTDYLLATGTRLSIAAANLSNAGRNPDMCVIGIVKT